MKINVVIALNKQFYMYYELMQIARGAVVFH